MNSRDLQEASIEAEAKTPWAAILGVIAMLSVFAIAQGLSHPLLSFILTRQGTPTSLIGLSAAMTPLGALVCAAFVPSLARRFGSGATTLACVALAAVLLAAIGATQDLVAWFPLRFLLGSAIVPLFVLSEVWIIALAPPERRGRVMGVYTTVLSAGFAAGPLVLALVGSQGWPPFLLGISAFLVCGIYLAAILPSLPSPEHATEKTSVRDFLPHAPFLLLAVTVTAAFALGILSLLPIYGLSYGIGEARMSAMLGIFVAGNIAFQVPLGLAAERFGTRGVMAACALATALGCLLLPLLIGTFFVWPLVFLWGAVSFGIYTLSLVELGARFSGAMLVAGNAAFAFLWGVGGMAGPPTTGLAMDVLGAEGLPITLGLLCLSVAAAGLMRPIPSRQ